MIKFAASQLLYPFRYTVQHAWNVEVYCATRQALQWRTTQHKQAKYPDVS